MNFDFKKPGGKLGAGFFKTHRSVCRSDFINSREVTKRATLPPGKYVIVPCTFRHGLKNRLLNRLGHIFKPYFDRMKNVSLYSESSLRRSRTCLLMTMKPKLTNQKSNRSNGQLPKRMKKFSEISSKSLPVEIELSMVC